MQERLLLLGDEAMAQAALDSGISGAYAYPGTPSTEILEYIQRSPEAAARGIHCKWSSNEKTAMEEALGMSYTGKRAMVSMKHVGLNVAADPFVNSAITGANGGLVLVVADDPSMHSSQNEQDSRNYARFAGIPSFEPSSQQEAYRMIRHAFDFSEEVRLPVLVRITTRLAHSRADIERDPVREPNGISLPDDPKQFTLLPVNARRNYVALLDKQRILEERSAGSPFNAYHDGPDRKVGILAAGIACNYVMENFGGEPCPHPVLKICQYPVPAALVQRLCSECDEILVVEEGAPFIEEMIVGLLPGTLKIRGRLDETLPRTGELTPDHVKAALSGEELPPVSAPPVVRQRPPQLCAGCPHRDTYAFLREVVDKYEDCRIFSDIGCYTLGALPPYNAIHSCVDMGASVTMTKGAADAGLHPAIGVIGDSTFTHSGITGLLDAAYENTNMVLIILDNDTTAMTGMQDSLASGRLEDICRGVGVAAEHVRVVTPLKKHHEENVRVLEEEIAYDGPSVIIARRPCIHLKRKI